MNVVDTTSPIHTDPALIVKPPISSRLLPAIIRRLRLLGARLRFSRARFGAGCDVRSGLHLLIGHEGHVEFGDRCVIDRDMTIECHGKLIVGARTIFGHHCTLAARSSIEIGQDCLIAELVSIRDHDHCFDRLDVPVRDQGSTTRPVRIGNNVWLGSKVTVVKGITIGDNAVIGANSVVTHDIPANAVAAGIPARHSHAHGAAVSDRPTISAVIVSYNTREMTLRCLDTLLADLGGISCEIWLVDNASTDGSAAAVRARFPQVRLIENTENRGFGAANNQAMQQAAGRFFLLLNSDAFPKTGAIPAMLAYLEAHPKAALVGPKLLNQDGSLQRSCFRFPSPGRAWLENLWLSSLFANHPRLGDYRHWPHDQERDVEWVVGACLLVRREVFEKVGGFDERFFMYAEESDWQKSMRDAGWEIGFTPAAEVTHLAGGSGAKEPARINRHFFQSLDAYELKHHGIFGLISLRVAMVLGCTMRGILWAITSCLAPQRRALAYSKTRLHWWLVVRQLTHWRITHWRT